MPNSRRYAGPLVLLPCGLSIVNSELSSSDGTTQQKWMQTVILTLGHVPLDLETGVTAGKPICIDIPLSHNST